MFFHYCLAERPIKVLLYSEFEQLLKDKQIEEVYVRSDFLEGKLKKPLPDGRELNGGPLGRARCGDSYFL
jgi:hypothetical protein